MTVLRYQDIDPASLGILLRRYGMAVKTVTDDAHIPGSFWQPPEAGLIDDTLYVRNDTPVHSALHEACHYICMDQERRKGLDTDAGGDYEEEDAVCYLQILLAEHIPEMGPQRMCVDMDSWGYSFRLGSAQAWFDSDAEDARGWLIKYDIIDDKGRPTFKTRQ